MFDRLKSIFSAPQADPRERVMVIGLGAMKAGTTWLSDYLASHPGFLLSPVKEMNIFNQFAENPFRQRDDAYRLMRIEVTILEARSLGNPKVERRLRSLAQIGRINDPEAYLAYFAGLLHRQTHFGEISPSYSYLPVETLRLVAGLTRDVRFLFLMRDPARQAASVIRHLRRRVRADTAIDTLIDEVAPMNVVWLRADYGQTIDRLEAAGVLGQSRIMVYETLFRAETTADLCDWLGLARHAARPDKIVNAGRGDELSPQQFLRLRERLEPIYADLSRRSLPPGTESWSWR